MASGWGWNKMRSLLVRKQKSSLYKFPVLSWQWGWKHYSSFTCYCPLESWLCVMAKYGTSGPCNRHQYSHFLHVCKRIRSFFPIGGHESILDINYWRCKVPIILAVQNRSHYKYFLIRENFNCDPFILVEPKNLVIILQPPNLHRLC